MKRIIFILMFMWAGIVSAQIGSNPSNFSNGIKTKFVEPDTLSTVIRDGLTPKLGALVYHKDTGVSRLEQWDGTAWIAIGTEITGAASTIVTNDLPINRAVISNGAGKIAESAVTTTELSYVGGVTSALQTQLDSKLPSASYTAADVFSKVLSLDGSGSGLDADLLRGVHWGNVNTNIVTSGSVTALDAVITDDLNVSAGDGFAIGEIAGRRRIKGSATSFTFLNDSNLFGNIDAGAGTFSSVVTALDAVITDDLNVSAGDGFAIGEIVGRRRIKGSATSFTFLNDANGFGDIHAGAGEFTGTVSGSDPVNADDFVTKGYGETNFATVTSGTFTPIISGLTFTIRKANERKIGDLVFIEIDLINVSGTTGSNGMLITGFSYGVPSSTNTSLSVGLFTGVSVNYYSIFAEMVGSTTDSINLTYQFALDGSNASLIPAATTFTSGAIRIAGSYVTDN